VPPFVNARTGEMYPFQSSKGGEKVQKKTQGAHEKGKSKWKKD